MSPTIFRIKKYRFYFLSNEESKIHIHVECEDGEAKFWIEPVVALATHYRLRARDLLEIQKIIEGRKNEIVKEWKEHFSQR